MIHTLSLTPDVSSSVIHTLSLTADVSSSVIHTLSLTLGVGFSAIHTLSLTLARTHRKLNILETEGTQAYDTQTQDTQTQDTVVRHIAAKAPIHCRTQSDDPISRYGKPVELTSGLAYPLISLVRSIGFP